MMGLDAINVLDKYEAVFDVSYYRSHKKWYMRQMLKSLAEHKHDYFEIYSYFKKQMTVDLYIFKIQHSIFYSINRSFRKSSLFRLLKRIKSLRK